MRNDCLRAREALGRVAAEVEAAPLEGKALQDGAFAVLLDEELAALDIDHPGLESSLSSFTETMRRLAVTRRKRDAMARRRAHQKGEHLRLRRQLDEAHVALGRLCDGKLEHCMMRGEMARVTSALTDERAADEQLAKQVARVRELVRESTMKLQELSAAEGALVELDEEIEALEEKAAGHGLEVGGHCSGA